MGFVHGTKDTAKLADLTIPELAETIRPAFMTAWKALADGAKFEDAVAAGLARSGSIGEFFVTAVSREALDIIDRQSPHITAWGREPEANACSWCEDVSMIVFASATEADIGHDNCHCSIEPA
jgi:hypothetical protein